METVRRDSPQTSFLVPDAGGLKLSSFDFWPVCRYISEMMQDNDIVTIEPG